jgi:hypothetical protein
MQICNRLYFSKTRSFLLLFLLLALPIGGYSQEKVVSNTKKVNSAINDSVSTVAKDSINSKSAKIPKPNQIDAEIDYSAKDSIVFLGNGTGFLHGESDIKYKNIDLKADFIRVKMDSSLIFARGTTDSIGKKIGEPEFSEGDSKYVSKQLTYNLKTKKGYIRQAVTQQGEGYVISDRTKKTTDETLCIAGGKYTTCENHDHPDFYLSLSKGKVKPGSYIVAGPAHLVIADVPLPIAVPFGFFPFTSKYSSGILMPSYTDELTRGFGLTNGGYYFALNDYMDMELRGDIYTKGTWAMSASTQYVKRYKFRGNLNVSFRNDVTGEKDLPNYNAATNLRIQWSHSQDTKANPYRTLSGSVNFSTSGYNRSNINSYYQPELNSENTKGSSISFSQRFPDSPFSLSGSVLINQQTKDSMISLTLPNLSISMSRIYPLKRKNGIGKERWYEKISMSYSGTFANSINTKERLLLSSSFVKDWKNGMRHSIPVSATFNILKYINVSPSFNYTERWYTQSTNQYQDSVTKKIKTDTIYGFNRVYDFNMGVSASTKLYGFYTPIRALFGDKIDRIRHVMTPSVGFSYMPDFGDPNWGYYGKYTRTDANNANPTVVQYSHYANSLYGTPGVGKSGSLNFSLSNNIEMKVRNDKDTTGTKPFTVISLIDNLALNGSYNLAADSMRWSILNASLRIKIKNYSLSLSGGFDPYMNQLKGTSLVRVNKLRWDHGDFPRFLGTSTSYSYTLSNDTFKKLFNKKSSESDKPADSGQKNTSSQDPASNGKNSDNKDKKVDKDEDGYEKLAIPWSISINYSVRYGQTNLIDPKNPLEYKMDFTHNLSLSGNISLTQNWKINASSSYDFKYKQFTYTNLSVTRNLHCWTMTANIVPFGYYKSYSFHLGVNASMLKDLKYDKQSGYGTNNITWY